MHFYSSPLDEAIADEKEGSELALSLLQEIFSDSGTKIEKTGDDKHVHISVESSVSLSNEYLALIRERLERIPKENVSELRKRVEEYVCAIKSELPQEGKTAFRNLVEDPVSTQVLQQSYAVAQSLLLLLKGEL
jgi:phage host-nuclease inhibitor protein Gam